VRQFRVRGGVDEPLCCTCERTVYPVDETRTRGPRADEPHPELPESLAWLYEPPPEERSRRRRSYAPGPPPTDIDSGAPRDPEALPTLLPFSAPPEEPPPAAHRGPVRGLRRAFARFDESRTDTSFRRSDAEEHDAERRAGGTTDWTTPVARPFAPPAHHGDDAHASEPDAQHDDDRYEEPLEAPAPDRPVPDESLAGVWAPDASEPEASVPDEPREPEGSVLEPVDRGSREEPAGDLPADETRLEDLGAEGMYEPQDERLEEPAEDAFDERTEITDEAIDEITDEPTGQVIGVGGDEPMHDQPAEEPSEPPWPRAWHDRAPTAVHHDRELNLFEPVPLDVPAEPPADPEPLPSWNRLVAWPSPDADDVASAESSAHVTEQPPAGDNHQSLEPAADPDRPPLPIRPRLATLVNRPAPLTDLPGATVPPSAVGPGARPDGVHDDRQAQDDAPDTSVVENAPDVEAEHAGPTMPEPRPRLSGLLRRPAADAPEPPPSDARTVDLRDPAPDVAIVDTPDTPDSAEVRDGEDAADPRAEAAQRFAIPPRPDLADPALTPLWVAVRDALQGGSRHDAPAVDVRGLDQSGRRALAGLLGVPTVRAATRVDLALLERIVAVTAGLPLAIAAERFVPAAGRRARAQSRTAPVRAAQEWLDAHPRLAAMP
jgi:hypothetical protein